MTLKYFIHYCLFSPPFISSHEESWGSGVEMCRIRPSVRRSPAGLLLSECWGTSLFSPALGFLGRGPPRVRDCRTGSGFFALGLDAC